MDFLFTNKLYSVRKTSPFPLPDQQGGRIVIMHQIYGSSLHFHRRKGGVCQLSFTTHGQGFRNGHDTFINGNVSRQHRRKHFRRQCSQNISLDTASHSVGQNQDLLVFAGNLAPKVAADTLSGLTNVCCTDLKNEISHDQIISAHLYPRPSEWCFSDRLRQPWFRQPSHPASLQFRERSASAFPQFRLPCWQCAV